MAGSAALPRLILAGALATGAAPVAGAAQSSATVDRLLEVHRIVQRLGRLAGDSLWPGFRPDTIPLLYVIPTEGSLLLGWEGPLPAEFTHLTGRPGAWRSGAEAGAASTRISLAQRGAAQVVVQDSGIARLVGLSLHEAFHVHAGASARENRKFGRGENAFLVTSYPVFDPGNEAGMALEGRLLAAALETREPSRRQELARQFIAQRELRHRRLGPTLAEFEQLAELNEGLAEYQQVRTAELLAQWQDFSDRSGAGRVVTESEQGLLRLTSEVTRSIRLRFYSLGSAQARLLDRMEGPGWKARLLLEDLTLQDALADAAGYREQERRHVATAEGRFDAAELRRSADSGLVRLRALRRRQVDSLLGLPGLRVVVRLDSLPGRTTGLCGIDPQNLLQVGESQLLHTRWVRPCRGPALNATANTPLLQDNRAGALTVIISPDDTLRMTLRGGGITLAAGQRLENVRELELTSPRFELRSARADVWREDRTLFILVKE